MAALKLSVCSAGAVGGAAAKEVALRGLPSSCATSLTLRVGPFPSPKNAIFSPIVSSVIKKSEGFKPVT